jgi:hypothetical protein
MMYRTKKSSAIEIIMYGIGEDSCASPIIWALMNQLLMMAIEDKFDCIHLVEVGGFTIHSIPDNSFVDDTMSGITNDDVTMDSVQSTKPAMTLKYKALITKMEDIIQFFAGLSSGNMR